jgi:aryl-alcohol dehydrogenase-like predicted oxidoreductase
MSRRSYGNSGLKITPMGLGLAALGRPGYINLGHAQDLKQNYLVSSMEAQAHTVLDAAWSLGIRYFDAARSYGLAEQFLASWLGKKSLSPDSVTVGSKWGYTYTADWQVEASVHEVKDHSLPVLQRQIKESRELLGDHLRLYQIHSATLESGVLDDSELLSELARLRDGGLAIGLSLSGPNQSATLYKALEIEFGGSLLFSSVQATWNLLEKSAGPALFAAKEAGFGIMIKEALANGRLTSRNEDKQFEEKRLMLAQVATEHETTMDAIALAFVLAQPWVDIALSGATTVDQLTSNLAALTLTFDERDMVKLARMVEEPGVYWKTRSQLAWN